MIWQITAIPLYTFIVPGPEVFFQRRFGETVPMVIYSFLLTCEKRAIIVDTGLGREIETLNPEIRARKGVEAAFVPVGKCLTDQVAAANVDVSGIILTSFGPYAAGGIADFPDTPLFASLRGLNDLTEPEEPALCHPLSSPIVTRLKAASAIDSETEITPGVTVVETGVHHPASAAVIVNTAHGRIGIADPVFTAENLTLGTALGASEHASGWHAMVRSIGRRVDAIIPIHNPKPVPINRNLWHDSLSSSPGRELPAKQGNDDVR